RFSRDWSSDLCSSDLGGRAMEKAAETPAGTPVGIIMGSQSDWPTMREAAAILDALGIAYEARIVSAHRTPDRLWDYGKTAVAREIGRASSRGREGGEA